MDKPGKSTPAKDKATDAGKKGGQASGSTGAGKMPDDRSKSSDAQKRGGQTPQGGGRK
ncbi:KGG domain-containing protein [Pseudomonas akapageensis]|uniref:KGG domain-containing protein n=1 Tax=Pseudomonas akapageensis TaxID=2609961 RepID=UPI001408BBFF|nr:KGG domain-containing protein [Pseudomonas akapageensis]